MKSKTIGRAVGIGVRVAGRIVNDRIAGSPQSAGPQPIENARLAVAASTHAASTHAASQARGSIGQGIGGFLRPFRRAGGIVWLEVTGVFFLLPVIVFSPIIWATRASWEHGPDHRRFLASVVLVAVFLYLAVTSFWRARKRAATQ